MRILVHLTAQSSIVESWRNGQILWIAGLA
jgi:hypothetical protein